VNIAARRLAAIATAGLLTAGLTAPAASALRPGPAEHRTQVTTEERPWNLFYDNIVTGDKSSTLILYTGASLKEHCTKNYPTETFRIKTKGAAPADGAKVVERMVTRGAFYVYDGGGLDAVQLIEQACAGTVPEPVATGRGVVHQRINVAFRGDVEPDVTDVNGVLGVVRTTLGKRWIVRGKAELTLSPEFSVDHVSFDILNRR